MPHYLTLTDDDLDTLLDEPSFEKFRKRKPPAEQSEPQPKHDHPRPEPPRAPRRPDTG